MIKWVLLILTLALAWYVWKDDDFGSSFVEKSVMELPVTNNESCEVNRIECGNLTRMLNAFRSGQYFEGAGKLLNTSLESTTILRGNNEVTFLVPDGTKVIHTQTGREKGNVSVIFSNGYTMRYNKKGNLIAAQ